MKTGLACYPDYLLFLNLLQMCVFRIWVFRICPLPLMRGNFYAYWSFHVVLVANVYLFDMSIRLIKRLLQLWYSKYMTYHQKLGAVIASLFYVYHIRHYSTTQGTIKFGNIKNHNINSDLSQNQRDDLSCVSSISWPLDNGTHTLHTINWQLMWL